MKKDNGKQLYFAINNLGNNFNKILDILAKEANLTKVQVTILMQVYKNNPCMINTVVEDLGLNQGNTSSICKKLETLGYIEKERNKNDERIVNLKLTEYGNEKIKIIEEKLKSLYGYFNEFEDIKIESIIDGLNLFNEVLNYIVNKER